MNRLTNADTALHRRIRSPRAQRCRIEFNLQQLLLPNAKLLAQGRVKTHASKTLSMCTRKTRKKTFPEHLLPSELMETPKYTETHKGAQKKGQREPNGAKSSQEPLRKESVGIAGSRRAQLETKRARVLKKF